MQCESVPNEPLFGGLSGLLFFFDYDVLFSPSSRFALSLVSDTLPRNFTKKEKLARFMQFGGSLGWGSHVIFNIVLCPVSRQPRNDGRGKWKMQKRGTENMDLTAAG